MISEKRPRVLIESDWNLNKDSNDISVAYATY